MKVWSSPDFVDTLNCTCVSVSGGYPNTTCPPKTQPRPSTRKVFSSLWPELVHQAVLRSSSSSYSVGER